MLPDHLVSREVLEKRVHSRAWSAENRRSKALGFRGEELKKRRCDAGKAAVAALPQEID